MTGQTLLLYLAEKDAHTKRQRDRQRKKRREDSEVLKPFNMQPDTVQTHTTLLNSRGNPKVSKITQPYGVNFGKCVKN